MYLFFLLNRNTIYEGVTVDGISIGGLNRTEALQILRRNKQKELEKININLVHKEYNTTIESHDIGLSCNYYHAIDEAIAVGREGSMISRVKEIRSLKSDNKNISMDFIYDKNKINSIINKIEADLNVSSKDASLKYQKYKLVIEPEVIGRKVNKELLEKAIVKSIYTLEEIEIPVEEDIPEVTQALLKKVNQVVGSYTTYYSGSSEGRVHNIVLSSKMIDEKLIMPGETFSFNYTTGARNMSAGYKESKVIVDGDYTSGIGGGVCQVSTTLYNAAILAGLQIVERHPHSIPASYVAKGQDSAVAYDYLDLKFKNILDYPVFIKTQANSSSMTVRIYGSNQQKGTHISIESTVEEEILPEVESTVDSSLSPGSKVIIQAGRTGYKVKTYKITYQNGKEIERQLLSEDFYRPRKYIIKLGPQATNAEHEEEQEHYSSSEEGEDTD